MLKRIKRFISKYLNLIKNKVNELYKMNVLWIILPFILIDVFMFIFSLKVSYSNYSFISPILFNISWITLVVGLSLSLKRWIGKILYSFTFLIFLTMFLTNNVYFSMTKNFFDFTLLESASEGSPYIMDAIKNCPSIVYFALIILVVFFIISLKKMPIVKKTNYENILKLIVIFIVIHLLAVISLGKANTALTWSSWRNPKNIYNSFNDNNKSLKISGLYEYTIRNFYKTFLKTKEQESEEDLEFLNASYQEISKNKNKWTGKLKDKNLIIIQLEGTDKWLITKDGTPTLYKLMNEGINFDKHYSYYNGGGSTFNSEFAVNTGFITPLSYTRNAYSFNKNSFPNSLANLFKAKGYSVNAFHMNNGEYYSRNVNYENWGYDNYYGLLDINNYTDQTYQLDRELILNESFNELLFKDNQKFLDYIITYSGHVPFDNTRGVCKMLYEEDMNNIEIETGVKPEFVQMTEEECVRRQAKETDYMLELLIDNLKDRNMLNDTVLVVFTDHYLYTLEDQSLLDRYKNTSNNLINNTPWFIWSKSITKTKITKVTSQLNILPTILNLFGIDYNQNNYIGEDALKNNYEGVAFFSDYSWYDGNVYVEDGSIVSGNKISESKLLEKNEYINYLTKKNDLTLKYNYFKK